MQKYLVEFIGTFFLILTIGMTVIDPAIGGFAPLTIGSILIVMVYAGGHISGAHYNPAVTLAVWLRGKCDTKDVIPYLASQIIAAFAAAHVVIYFKQDLPTVSPNIEILPVFLAEVIFTFALCHVILHVATSKKTANNSYYGLAIGLTVMAGIFTVGGISGGVFNPAVAIAGGFMKLIHWGNIWIFFAAQIVGAVLASGAFRLINRDEYKK